MDILLVEDSPLVRDRLHRLLAAVRGAKITNHAASARAAVSAILAERPDVVVLDVQLEQGNGYDVLRAVREAVPQTRFYVLSNFASEPYRRLAMRLGATDFFDKTREFHRVREAIESRAAHPA